VDQSDSSIGVGTNAKSPEPKEPSEEDSLSSGLFFFVYNFVLPTAKPVTHIVHNDLQAVLDKPQIILE